MIKQFFFTLEYYHLVGYTRFFGTGNQPNKEMVKPQWGK